MAIFIRGTHSNRLMKIYKISYYIELYIMLFRLLSSLLK